MAEFRDLGLREELLNALDDAELERPTALQEAVVPTLRRGSNVVARASAGAGKTLAYALGVLDRLSTGGEEAEEDGEVALRFLIVAPTAEEAERIALTVFPYAQATGLTLTVAGGAWGTRASDAEILVTPAAALMDAVRTSALKLEAVEAIVIDGASTIAELGDWEAVDSTMDLLPRDAQRVVLSAVFDEAIQDLVDRRVKRALGYPAESVVAEAPQPLTGEIGYVLVSGRQKVDVLARQLAGPKDGGGSPPVIFCRTDDRAAELAEELSVRGFVVGDAHDTDADVAIATSDTSREELLEEEGALGQTLSYDVPPDAATLLARHGGDADAVVLIEPRELPHLKEVARQARLGTRSTPVALDTAGTTARLEAFRAEIRRAIQEEDLAAQLLVLEPLLDEFSAAEVAAAAAALLRHRRAAAPAPQQAAPRAPAARAEAGTAPATWARLYVGVGSKDEVRPGDLVGALAGEANIPGSKIGKIEIRESFSVVEVEASVADTVIRAVNGTTLKGRSVRVDYDRGGDRGRRAGGAPPRRTTRRPPREQR